MTEVERKLWHLLRGRRFSGYKFRRQCPIGRYIVDFICLERRLVIEADGGQHNGSDRDAARDAWLNAQGYAVLRFWNADVFTRRNEVSETVWAALNGMLEAFSGYAPSKSAAQTPHPAASQPPSPARGEGAQDDAQPATGASP